MQEIASSSKSEIPRSVALFAAAIGAVAVGAFAIGAPALRRLAVREVVIERAKFKSLEIENLRPARRGDRRERFASASAK